MTFQQAQLNSLVPIVEHITGNTAVVIADATDSLLFVPRLQVNENAGGTPSLSVLMTNGTTTVYLANFSGTQVTWKAKAMTAAQSVDFVDIMVPVGWQLKVLSSDAAGKMDVIGVRTSGR
jgi:hypothetical protein